MAETNLDASQELAVRAFEERDRELVLDLVNHDRILGQPMVGSEMLNEALSGDSVIDRGWWAELEAPTTDVVLDSNGRVDGVVSYSVRPSDNAGFVLWMHGREEPQVLAALVERALTRLGQRTVYAFEFASALTLGLEGLPAGHRPATYRALEAAGFRGRDLWRYMHAQLPLTGLPHVPHYEAIDVEEPPGKRLVVRDGGELLAEATVGGPVDGIGVLWWISTVPGARRRGLGSALLGSSMDLLEGLGAREVILFVDDDASADDPERSRAAANRMYDRAGLVEIDRLFSFVRQP
ncbi:GNAT family N-acetyltransferase [Streptomyces silvisoli]|uniref:GNAT family N-acetyltransferase n=1 Tax=Streptomyces silvisoli TaxID=3034235 RepID=A0ABT5ZJZ3_9ACTN|nr:GNAT family N-acetyltransferase [Streptomyces silvisoli]MDF3290122.1 GNAT family N-acetyltransferase [Streptomyces silvisoli]